MSAALRALLVGGPMYEPLYATLAAFSRRSGIEVAVQISHDHPDLNARLAAAMGTGAAYDLVSTHTKYAPAQRAWLTPLPELDAELTDFLPAAVDLARIDGGLYGVPRNFDVKLLYWRTDLMARPPETWDDLRAVAPQLTGAPGRYGFAFPGCESGLFGHFFELTAVAGGQLFGAQGQVQLDSDAARWALDLLAGLHRSGVTPPETPDMRYDEVAACFRDGRAALTTDWPAGYGVMTDAGRSRVHDRFDVVPCPQGRAGRAVYAGSHTFAIPRTALDRPAALDLLRFLVSPESQLLEARQGSLPARQEALAAVRRAAAPGSRDARRLDALAASAAVALVPPRLAAYPAIEDALWRNLRRALTGELSVDQALRAAAAAVREQGVEA